ncbi:hypothetical protein D3C72_2200170 [compost metagenome]
MQAGRQHALAHQVPVAGVLHHRAADHFAQHLAVQAVFVHQPAQGVGEHGVVGELGVGGAGAGKGDAVGADDGDLAGLAV